MIMPRSIKTTQKGKRIRTTQRNNKTSSCFLCWYKRHACERSHSGCCFDCKPNHNHPDHLPLTNALPLDKSNVTLHRALEDIVLHNVPQDITIAIAIKMTRIRHRESSGNQPFTSHIHVNTPFWPVFQSLTKQMDELARSHLSLQIRDTDDNSRLVQDVSMAGGYLCLLFPSAEAADKLPQLGSGYSNSDDDERCLSTNLARFSVLRFAELIDPTMTAMRSIGTAATTHHDGLNIIAAAGVLYSELDYVIQGLLHGKLRLLCDHLDLKQALKRWFTSLTRELMTRLRTICGRFRVWSEHLEQPLKRVKRSHRIESIAISIQSPAHEPSLAAWSASPFALSHSTSADPSPMSSAYTTPDKDSYDLKLLSQGQIDELKKAQVELVKVAGNLHDFPQNSSSVGHAGFSELRWVPRLAQFDSESIREPSSSSTEAQNDIYDTAVPTALYFGDPDQIEGRSVTSQITTQDMLTKASNAEQNHQLACSFSDENLEFSSSMIKSLREYCSSEEEQYLDQTPFQVPAMLPYGNEAGTSETVAFDIPSQYGYWDSSIRGLDFEPAAFQPTGNQPFMW